MKTVVVLSGGLDSTTALARAIHEGDEVAGALFFYYGQRHNIEREAAVRISKHYDIPLITLDVEKALNPGSSTLVAGGDTLPVGEAADAVLANPIGTSPTWVPARNLIFITIAAHWAITWGAKKVILGIHMDDFGKRPVTWEWLAGFYNNDYDSFQTHVTESDRDAFDFMSREGFDIWADWGDRLKARLTQASENSFYLERGAYGPFPQKPGEFLAGVIEGELLKGKPNILSFGSDGKPMFNVKYHNTPSRIAPSVARYLRTAIARQSTFDWYVQNVGTPPEGLDSNALYADCTATFMYWMNKAVEQATGDSAKHTTDTVNRNRTDRVIDFEHFVNKQYTQHHQCTGY